MRSVVANMESPVKPAAWHKKRGAQNRAPRTNVTSCTARWLERVPQRELNQSRRTHGAGDLAERTVRRANALHVEERRVREVGVVPDVEEVRREAKRLPLGDLEILDQREVEVRLARSAER